MTIYTGAGIEIAMTEARIAPIWIEIVEMTVGYKQANRHLSPPTTEHKVTETAGFFARLQVKGGHILHGGRSPRSHEFTPRGRHSRHFPKRTRHINVAGVRLGSALCFERRISQNLIDPRQSFRCSTNPARIAGTKLPAVPHVCSDDRASKL
jgi:hypothetical protein